MMKIKLLHGNLQSMERRKGLPHIGGGGEEEEHSADCVARRLTQRERERNKQWGYVLG